MGQSAWAGCVLGFMHFSLNFGMIDQNMSALAQGLLGLGKASVLGRERVLANQEYRRAQHAKRKRVLRSPPGRERIDGKPLTSCAISLPPKNAAVGIFVLCDISA